VLSSRAVCGIVGVFHFERDRPVDAARLERQLASIVHRGPDGGGVWVEPGVGLAHRRLSIIDLGGGAQPMFDASGRYVTTFNGELYNYRELREELTGLGHVFRTDSDTEVLLAAYAAWGQGCLDRFNGMFAFAIHDRKEHRLFLARDRLGKKPLYVYRDEGRVVFASELKAITADPMVPRRIDATSVADYCAMGYVPAPKTIWRDVAKLPAGHLAIADASGFRTAGWWDVDLRQPDHATPIEVHARRLRELIDDAVRLRLRSDVPLGAFLSGGVDSTAVVGVMAKVGATPPFTQTIGFTVARFDERRYAADAAARFGTRHHERVLAPEAGLVARQLSHFFDEPFADSSAVPTYYLCDVTRENVTVALSGDGGDELFTGYTHYQTARWTDRIHDRLPELVWRAARAPLRHLLHVTRYVPAAYSWNRTLFRASDARDRNAWHNHIYSPWRWRELLSEELLDALGDYDPFESVAHHYARAGTDDLLARMQYADLKGFMCEDILAKVDRASMAHALEVRCPLLDHRVVEYAGKIPPLANLHDGGAKLALKKAVEDLVPPSFFDREKQGFSIPVDDWFRSGLRDMARDLLVAPGGRRSGLLGKWKMRRLFEEHQRGIANGHALWMATMLELWHERWVEGAAPPIEPTRTMRDARPPVRVLSPT
jgi:asparagine synthase (glutamine-hydrolysing)